MKAKKKVPKKLPGFVRNSSLNKYHDVILFPEKVAKANEILKAGVPKNIEEDKHS